MMDWSIGIENRNYGIKRVTDSRVLSELLCSTLCLALVAAALLFHSWVRSQIINIGYETQRLFTDEEALLRTQAKLILEEETLRSPERIDTIARTSLGMSSLRPSQLIPPQLYNEPGTSNAIAMVDSKATGLRKPAANY